MLPPAGRPSGTPRPDPAPAPAPLARRSSAPIKRRSNLGSAPVPPASVSPSEKAAFATIEAEMGGRQRLVTVLAAAQLPGDLSALVARLADPRNDNESLALLAAAESVTLAKMMKAFREATLARGQMIAIGRIAEKAPDVAAAVMDDALPGWRICGTCLGAKDVADPTDTDPARTKPCPECRGRGEIAHFPDHEVQKTALQMAGLLAKGGGSVQVTTLVAQQNNNAGADSGSYDRLITALDATIYGSGRERLRRPAEIIPIQDGDVEEGAEV